MKTFLLLMLLLDAKTGEGIDHFFETGEDGEMMTIDECNAAQAGRVVHAKDGIATVYVCFNTKPTQPEIET